MSSERPSDEHTPDERHDRDASNDETIGVESGESEIAATAPLPSGGEQSGAWIDRYRLRQPLGEGGFGTVWEADQLEPVKRRVALKVIKLGMDTKEVIARFEAERQALALMEHPNIAQVLDAGATETGRPYFVMELVQGLPVTEYCDRRQMNLSERLDLFVQICTAVQHAHQKGIIHRDIKPSNVLVGEVEGRPAPKVIDFGIAKATSQRLTEKTVFTQIGQFVGTPEYMSPEQAESTNLDVDTRTDVYSLGVLLYELLTGTTPFKDRDLRSVAFGEIQRIIREEEPPRPSTRASTLGDRAETVAEDRRQRSGRLARSLRGELDWIVMKCLEKDRSRRYETVNGLVMDIRRHLADEPVTASPPSRVYRLRKLVRRNRAVFVSGSVMAALLLAGVIGTSVGMVRAQRAETEAVQQALRADLTADFLTDMLKGVGPAKARGRDTEMLEEILAETEEKVGEELQDHPDVEASIRSVLGVVYFDLGKFDPAAEHFHSSLDLYRETGGEVDEDVAQSLNNLALVRWGEAEYAAAESLLVAARDMRLELFGPRHRQVAASQRDLANVLVAQSRYPDAEAPLLDSIDIQREVLADENLDELAISLNSMGNLLMHLSRFDEAGPYFTEALDLHTRILGADHPFTVTDLHNLAWLAYYQGDFDTSEERFREALATSRRIYGDAHPKLVDVLDSISSCLQRKGAYDEAIDAAKESVAMATEVFGPDHLNTADSMGRLADVLGEIGRNDEADELNNQVLEITRAELGDDHPETLNALHNVAYDRLKAGDYEAAESGFRESLVAYEKIYGRQSKDTSLVINNLGRTLRASGELEEAVRCFEEAGAIRGEVLGEDHYLVTVSMHDLAKTRHSQERFDESADMMEHVLREYPEQLAPDHRVVAIAQRDLAVLELDRRRPGRVRELMEAARVIAVAALGEDDALVIECDLLYAAALSDDGDLDGAEALFETIMPRYGERRESIRSFASLWHGRHLTNRGDHAGAEEALLGSYEIDRAKHGDDHPRTRRVIRALASLCDARGDEAGALRWRGRLDGTS